ncbi:hypothetical protein Tco_1178530, partial [Tanacetum coccineum]
KHNMIACVEKTERNADFHEVIDFLTGCYVNYALLVSPDVIQQWIQQFWNTTKVRMINEVAHIEAKIKATLSKKKKLKKAHKKKSSSFKQGRKKVSDGSIGLNEDDVLGDSQMMDVEDTITTEVHEGTAQVNKGTTKVNEGTAEVNKSTVGANLSTEPSMKKSRR